MVVDFEYKGIDFHIAVHQKLLDKSDKKTKAYRKYGVGAPRDSVSARIYKAQTFYSIGELENSLNFIPAGSTIVDCGAFIGSHTVFWNRINKNKVIAIEPLPENFELLKKNIQINGCTDCVANQCLISDGEKRFSCKSSDRRRSATQFVLDPKGDYISTTLDALIGDTDVSFIKMDVEGEELLALKGARNTLERGHPVLHIEVHAGVEVNAVMDYLSNFKYQINEDVFLKNR